MKEKLLSFGVKFGAPVFIVLFGIIIANVMVKVNAKDNEEQPEPPPPLVTVSSVVPESYQVTIDAWGEVQPKERTQLSSFVSGEVVGIHDAFNVGGLVAKGEVLVNIDESDYEAGLIEAESNLAAAQANLEQEIALAEVAKEEWSSISKEKVSSLALRKPQLLSAKAGLKAAEAALSRALKNLERCKIKAPYDALIVSRQIGTGQVVNQGSVLGEVFNIESAEVILPVAGFDAPFLPKNIKELQAKLTVADSSQLTRDVKIDRDLGVIDRTTRMSNLVAVIDDPYGLRNNVPSVKFGSYVKVTVPGVILKNVISVDQEVIVNSHVWVVDGQNQLVEKEVVILREEGGQVLISKGLQAGERLVTQVPEYPQSGMQVKVSDGTDSGGIGGSVSNDGITKVE